MKKILLTVFVFASLFCNAQNCLSYYYFQNNKTITMGLFDKKGGDNGKVIYTVSNVASDTANVRSEVFSKKGESVGKGNSTVKCSNGMLLIDMQMMMPPQPEKGPFNNATANAKVSGSFLEYPATMNAGDKLKDGAFTITTNNGGPGTTIDFSIFDRKVDGKESVTTPAGTWDCIKISYTAKLKVKAGPIPIFTFNSGITEWYAPGFGIVQSESKFGTTKIISIQ